MSKQKENQTISCVGFIMDGNRRWARARGLDTARGHERGYANLKEIIDVVYAHEIPHIICYAFSSENWKRSKEEVEYLLQLFLFACDDLDAHRDERRINLKFVGERERFDLELREKMERIEKSSHPSPVLTVWIALSYGGRGEIVDAVNRAVRVGALVTEESFNSMLWTSGMPDPDLIIRTSGEQRLSNFLLWQSAYSELFFTDTLWPDFGKMEFESIVEQYEKRQRRTGA